MNKTPIKSTSKIMKKTHKIMNINHEQKTHKIHINHEEKKLINKS